MSTLDEKINQMFDLIEKKKESLKSIDSVKKQSWKTNCSVTIEGKSPINIQTTSAGILVEIVSYLLMVETFKDRAQALLGQGADLLHCNYPIRDWIDDCKKRAAILKYTDEKKIIEELEERLNSIVSPDKKREIELDRIEKLLSK